MYLLGYDIGSSSIKAAIVDIATGKSIGHLQSPKEELEIISLRPGWAEQKPMVWWKHVTMVTNQLLKKTGIDHSKIKAIGIAYQMHGLVALDRSNEVVRPSIIWCDSRAGQYGQTAYEELGPQFCKQHYLNSPGNFTASKLKWVQENEPSVYEQISKVMLVGDYIAFKMTGELCTTKTGLSEGILWDFNRDALAVDLLSNLAIDQSLIPGVVDTIGPQGKLHQMAAEELGLIPGIPITYRAGDQPNNAMSLNVLNPGEVAATGGTSGVVYSINDQLNSDPNDRVNNFAHVNHTKKDPRIGVLLCINGAGILYGWLKKNIANPGTSYTQMEEALAQIPIGSDGLQIIPFGNGSERMLANKNLGAQINNLQFNRHGQHHLYRAALEGIAYSFVLGLGFMRDLGIKVKNMKVGNDNLFQSQTFSRTISNLTGATIEMVNTTGAIGAAKAAGYAIGCYSSLKEAMSSDTPIHIYEPEPNTELYQQSYLGWVKKLNDLI